MISESDQPVTSEMMAGSAGTNASYIRRILSGLKNRGIITSHRGSPGYALAVSPESLSLLTVYHAVCGDEIHLLDIHRNTSDACIVGKYIQPVLHDMFTAVETMFAVSLQNQTLADCIDDMRNRLEKAS